MTHEMFGALGTPRYLEYARLIHESGVIARADQRHSRHVEDRGGQVRSERGDFRPEDAVQQALRFLRLQSERKGVALKMALAPEARMIFGDRRA